MKWFFAITLPCLVMALATPAVAADVAVSGEHVSLKGGGKDPKKRTVEIALKDAAIAPPFGDPKNGASLHIVTSDGDKHCSVEIPLEAKDWSARGRAPAGGAKGYLYRGKPKRAQGIRIVKLKPGKITVRGGGKFWPCELGADSQPQPLRIELRVGGAEGTRYCAAFGGTVKTNKKGRFRAKGAPAPESCAERASGSEP